MENLNPKYYEPLEQMMSVRHQYMGKIISLKRSPNIYDFFKNQHILDLGCGTGKFLHNYYELGAICSGVDLVDNFQFQNKKNYKLINSNFQNFLKKNRKKFDVIVGMYHDQVLTPLKTLYEYDAINITLGLPFIRVSPDHGPNERMLGKNLSNPLSLIRAMKFLDSQK